MATHDWHLGEDDFFADLAAEREAFLRLSRRRELAKGDMIFFEDDAGESCFYLEHGLIKIFRIAASGKEPIFFLRHGGEMFGLAEVMESETRKANAQALSPCVLHEIDKREFEKFLAENFRATRKVIRILGRRLRYLGEQLGNLMSCDVGTRLAKLLVYIAHDELSAEDSWRRPVILPVALTQEQMAAMTGSCQQTVSEFLKRFQEEGLVRVGRKKITILDPLKLLEKAEK
ncbi:transcriptional regulator, Crp/Fnr family [Alkalidesulfovibrio alkalitolerans DSM 16529]|uniref:Transcriptional regulator, Crp/Fnr family n=1 Tax=Alkalidesulfovibrio alkalitolerans DSM 16529 TaxID=1121439 RepID=S7UN99_9BACT|nr:transcriptional regulator, Crp/Fnr family [Alkalidesulfovibrio alkalitolerans DSM 16529]